jgi:type I restriction enzyme S subunit
MSRIEELIEELCPEGVEWRMLGECLERTKGTPITAHQMSEINKEGAPIKIFAGGKTVAFVDYGDIPEKDILTKKSIVVKSRGIIEFEYIDKPFSHKNEFWSYNSNNINIIIKYVYYYLKSKEPYFQSVGQRMSKIPQLSIPDTDKFPIPIPPLPIQQEIVTILDTFTALDAQLQAELEARRKQYEHYRNELLNFEGKEVEWKTLGEVGKFIRGKRFVKNDIVSEGIPCIHYGEMYTYYKTWTKKTKSFLEPEKAEKLRFAKPGDVIIVTAGETIEDIGNAVAWLGETNVVIHDACFAYSHNFNPKFVSYYFQTDLFRSQIRKHISSSKISAILESGLSQATIPIPPLIEQERIVGILDKFEALVSGELPAEIAARRKQYEYYREKLLTFKPLTTNH